MLFLLEIRGQPYRGKGVFVVPFVRNSGANLIEGRGFRCFLRQKLRGQPKKEERVFDALSFWHSGATPVVERGRLLLSHEPMKRLI